MVTQGHVGWIQADELGTVLWRVVVLYSLAACSQEVHGSNK